MGTTSNYGAAPTYVKIASQTPGAVSSVTFSNIPQGYTDLVVVVNGALASGSASMLMRFNSDSGTTYSGTRIVGNGTSATSDRTTGATQIDIGYFNASMCTSVSSIQNYSSSSIYKTVLVRANTTDYVFGQVQMWRNTVPVTSISITNSSATNFTSSSTFTIYGIKAALTPKATGGDLVVNDGVYWYHAFRTTGAFSPKQSLTADVLQIAGGGGGGGNEYGSSGGGAGGLVAYTSQSLTATNYTVTVGGGGAAKTDGSNSQFGSLTASVGGGKGTQRSSNGGNGGSGGGAASQSSSAGTGTSGQGNNGGTGAVTNIGGWNYYVGGGGGGAGAAGGNGANKTAGNGGAGLNTYSSWAYVTGTGASGYYAGGGGAAATIDTANTGLTDAVGGTGGSGGGGNGGAGNRNIWLSSNTSGAANTGGGGGASGQDTSGVGGSGGSGLIIVRYPV